MSGRIFIVDVTVFRTPYVRAVNASLWELIMKLYGGGPAIHVDVPPEVSGFGIEVFRWLRSLDLRQFAVVDLEQDWTGKCRDSTSHVLSQQNCDVFSAL